MRELGSEITIDAPPEDRWRVLMDLDAYPEWNPFIRSIEGDPQVGSRPSVRIQPPGVRGMTFRLTVRAGVSASERRWLSRRLVPGLADGDHRLAPGPLGGRRSRFIQSERFSGLLVGLLRSTPAATPRGLEQMTSRSSAARRWHHERPAATR